jgi:2-oxoglutarate ferredoxin oxidoreductase subunit beta
MILDTGSVLGCAVDDDRVFSLGDYEGAENRWCAGCGDHGALTAAQRLMRDEQLTPEKTVFVSGIGCSGRFPHYMSTYGFHGIHGRALPIATGLKLTRPDLDVFAVMGDGDCLSIGAGHWVHAVRYNVDMVALLLDNNIYGLTKKQTSPTTPQGYVSNTQPHGTYLPALNPMAATLGISNASFVAQTAEWNPLHMLATLKAAYHHKGFAFVRILQRCPHFTPDLFRDEAKQPDLIQILTHENGISAPGLEKFFKDQVTHDPSDLDAARAFAEDTSPVRLGLFFHDDARPCYDDVRRTEKRTAKEKMDLLNEEFERYAI